MHRTDLFDFLIRHRHEILALAAFAILLPGFWVVWRLRRQAAAKKLELNGLKVSLNLPGNILSNLGPPIAVSRSTLGVLASIIGWIKAIAEAASKWPKVSAAFCVLAIAVLLGLWLFDRNETHIVTAGLNFPAPQCTPPERAGTIVFIHGWTGDAKETWKRYPELMCDDARFSAFEIVSVGYPTLMARRGLTVAQMAEWIQEGLRDELKIKETDKVIFIAHSMGGLVAREITILRRLAQSPGTVVLLAEIGSPHNGAAIAPLAAALGLSKDLTRDMLEDSSALKSLQVGWNQLAPKPQTLCYSSPQDSVVNEASAFFQCDYQLAFPVWSHTEMVKPESRDDSRYRLPTQEISTRLHLD
jgi:pimeloyl-ACP methyl ester carboxylesterase